MMNLPDPFPHVQWLYIDSNCQGQRIDNFLLRVLKGVPKSKIYNILRRGEVRVNKGRIKPNYRLCTGDEVRIPPIRQGSSAIAFQPSTKLLQTLRTAILLEDDDVLVLNKPSGLAVHKGSGVEGGVIEALRVLYPDQFLELAHRLDRETSGCLLLAKNPIILRTIQQALQSSQSHKRYLTLVRGRWQLGTKTVSLALRKNTLRSGERLVRVDPKGKPAQSRFKAVSNGPGASLLEVSIATGRTHQIRVHAASLGHPIAGDNKYGEPGFNQYLRTLGLRRLFLHAQHLSLNLEGRDLSVDAPLAEDLEPVLQQLKLF